MFKNRSEGVGEFVSGWVEIKNFSELPTAILE
jgi:hypothetical protein